MSIKWIITGTKAEYQTNSGSLKDTPYLALTGELWGAFCKYLWENWPRYNGTAIILLHGAGWWKKGGSQSSQFPTSTAV